MAQEKYYYVSDTELTNIADSIRYKNGQATTYTIAEMPNAIKAITDSNDGYVSEPIRNAFAQQGIYIAPNTLLSELPNRIANDYNWVVNDGNSYFHYQVPENAPSVDTIHYLCDMDGTVSWGKSLLSYDLTYTHTGGSTLWGSDNYEMEPYRGKKVYLKFTGTLNLGIYGSSTYSFVGYIRAGEGREAISSQLYRAEIGDNCGDHTYAIQGARGLREVYISENSRFSLLNYCFADCRSLKKIYIGNANKQAAIGNYAFRDCSALTDFTIPDTVTSIGEGAFYGCQSLTKINITDKIKSIGTGAFRGCVSLKSIYIPTTITKLPNFFVAGCQYLQSIEIPENITEIGDNGIYSLSSITSLTIPANVKKFGNYGAALLSKCTSISVQGVQTVGNQFVFSCTSLTSLSLNEGLTTAGTYFCANNTSLTTLTIPSTVTTLGNYAFAGNTKMQEYHFLSTTPPAIGTNSFKNIPSTCIIYVPNGSLNAYQTATNWTVVASQIQEEAEE